MLDRQAVEALVRAHQDSVRGFLRVLGCPPAQVDDLTQETFLALLAARFEDRGPSATRAYLRRVARNLLLKALRREHRRPPTFDLREAEEVWIEFEEADGGERYLAALRACLQRVSERARDVLGLRYRDGLDRRAIAERLGLSEAGVKSVLLRSKAKLRACIERRTET